PVLAVEEQPAAGVDLRRTAVQPPVHQVEVVGRLVYQQTTGVALVTVPAPEVVRAVADVQQPFEVDRADLAHHALGEQLPDPLMDRVVTVVERYRDVPAGACHGVQDLPAAGDVDGHRLLGDHVAARLQRGHDVLRMGAV